MKYLILILLFLPFKLQAIGDLELNCSDTCKSKDAVGYYFGTQEEILECRCLYEKTSKEEDLNISEEVQEYLEERGETDEIVSVDSKR